MSNPVSKRRKLDHKSNSVLFKPFKSPLKVASPENKPPINPAAGDPSEDQPQEPKKAPQWNLSRPTGAPKLAPNQQPTELNLLRREESRLLAQLSKLKVERDQIKQAAGIEKSLGDAELTKLIRMWKSASQQAAEEVFATFRDKVNASGGMRCWREMERAKAENAVSIWESEADTRPRNGSADEDENGQREEDCEGNENENSTNERDDQDDRMQSTEEEEFFSMDVMLRYLGIKLDVIGYDDQDHRWLA